MHLQLPEMTETGRHFKTDPMKLQGAITLTLHSGFMGSKSKPEHTSPAGDGRDTSGPASRRSMGEQPISSWRLRLYSISTQAWVVLLRKSRVSGLTLESMAISRPSNWPQKDSCLP